MAFAVLHGFWIAALSLSFASIYFLIASLISSDVHWLFGNILFSLCVFVFFPVFFFFFSCN